MSKIGYRNVFILISIKGYFSEHNHFALNNCEVQTVRLVPQFLEQTSQIYRARKISIFYYKPASIKSVCKYRSSVQCCNNACNLKNLEIACSNIVNKFLLNNNSFDNETSK